MAAAWGVGCSIEVAKRLMCANWAGEPMDAPGRPAIPETLHADGLHGW
jgi:hypothetical protein